MTTEEESQIVKSMTSDFFFVVVVAWIDDHMKLLVQTTRSAKLVFLLPMLNLLLLVKAHT